MKRIALIALIAFAACGGTARAADMCLSLPQARAAYPAKYLWWHYGADRKARAERRRAIVRDAMLEAGVDKLAMPDFTASVRKGPPHVVIVDEALIPATFWEQRPHLRKRELGEALKDGAQIEGAVLSNPGMTLSVRTR